MSGRPVGKTGFKLANDCIKRLSVRRVQLWQLMVVPNWRCEVSLVCIDDFLARAPGLNVYRHWQTSASTIHDQPRLAPNGDINDPVQRLGATVKSRKPPQIYDSPTVRAMTEEPSGDMDVDPSPPCGFRASVSYDGSSTSV